uniref:Opsin 9 n=1 Tax=Myripristis murdjan TaxID=586833 RepID=A0A667WPK6_9TELE
MGMDGSQWGSWLISSSIHPLFRSHLSHSADLALATFLIITGVMSLLGNGLVLLVYSRKRKKLKPPELMTINLAVCDFGFSLLGAPFPIISSLCHAWVFGETGCLWYGMQGFVFGIGSLLTTCLISMDRCLKICCFRYGQWIGRRHVSLSIGLLWVYTFFWASLPAFGFGSYGPEPYGTSCTINWWRMRSFLNDRVYIILILMLCFGFPTLTIITSYLAILLTVYRSNRTLASISSTFVSHTSKDLRLTKIAAVVCSTFLLAWTPYATVSLYSALIPRDELEAENTSQTVVDETTGSSLGSPTTPKMLDFPSLLNWTAQYYGNLCFSAEKWRDVANVPPSSTSGPNEAFARLSSSLDQEREPVPSSSQPVSCLPPIFTLIPAMFAKSHCMINPFIYQIMNREFRDDVYEVLFGREKAERRRVRGREGRSISLSYSLRRRSRPKALSELERRKKRKNRGRSKKGSRGSWTDDISVQRNALDSGSLDTQVDTGKELGGSIY